MVKEKFRDPIFEKFNYTLSLIQAVTIYWTDLNINPLQKISPQRVYALWHEPILHLTNHEIDQDRKQCRGYGACQ